MEEIKAKIKAKVDAGLVLLNDIYCRDLSGQDTLAEVVKLDKLLNEIKGMADELSR